MYDILAGFDAYDSSVPIISQDYHAVVSHDLMALRKAWTNLEARAPSSAFQSYAWCSAWAEAARAAGLRERPCLITVWRRDRLVLIWPLVERRFGPLRILQSFGEPATQNSDLLVEPDAGQHRWIQAAWAQVHALRGIDAVLLKGVRADAALGASLAGLSNALLIRSTAAPFADFRPIASEAVRHRSGRTRNALQRHLRNLSKHGPVTLAVVTDAVEREAAMCSVLNLKQAWLDRMGQVSAGYAHPANTDFLKRLAHAPDFVTYRLMVGAETAALEAGLLRDGRYWSLVQSYDARYASHGPGRLLFWHLIEKAEVFGINVFDFLAPATRHKSEWSNGATAVHDYVIPTQMRGRLVVFYVCSVRPRLKAVLLHLLRWTKICVRMQRGAE